MGQPAKVLSVTPVSNTKLNEIKSKNNIKKDLIVFAYDVSLDNGDKVNIIVGDSHKNNQPDADDVFKVVEGDNKVKTFDVKDGNKIITVDDNTLKTQLSKAIPGTTIKNNTALSHAFILTKANALNGLLTNKNVTAPPSNTPGATKMNTGEIHLTELALGKKTIQLTIFDRNKNGIVDKNDAFKVGSGVKSVVTPTELIAAMKAAKISIEYEDANASTPTWDKVNENNLKKVTVSNGKINNNASDMCSLSSLYSPVEAPTVSKTTTKNASGSANTTTASQANNGNNTNNAASATGAGTNTVNNTASTPTTTTTTATTNQANNAASQNNNDPDKVSFTSEQFDALKEYGITQEVVDKANNTPVAQLKALFKPTPGETNQDHINNLSDLMIRNLFILKEAAKTKNIELPTINSACRTKDEQKEQFEKKVKEYLDSHKTASRNEAEEYASKYVASPESSWHVNLDGKGGKAVDFHDSNNSDNDVLADIWTKMGNRWGGDFDKASEPWHFDLGPSSGKSHHHDDDDDNKKYEYFNPYMAMINPYFGGALGLQAFSNLGYNFGYCTGSLLGGGNMYDMSFLNYEDQLIASVLGGFANYAGGLASAKFGYPSMFGGFSHRRLNEYKSLPVDLSEKVTEYKDLVDKYSKDNGLDPEFVFSMIKQESGFVVDANSGKARGLMQLKPTTAEDLGVKNILDPEENIKGGTKYIAQQLETFNNDKKLALAAYNCGANYKDGILRSASSYDEIKSQLPKETQDYVDIVMKNYETFDQWGVKKKPVV